ncbi:MAG: hypothetical protein H7X95_12620, partial [Deltaproteobacteria bacterium]|nr:hypothetical protein [Deltaproteobacteria bacterium]
MILARNVLNGRSVTARAAILMVAWTVFGCGTRSSSVVATNTRMRPSEGPTVSSNVLRKDYVGSAACQGCHGDVVAAWRRSPMHRMTRLPEQTEIRAPFDGRAFRFKGDIARFEQVKDARFMRLTSSDGGTRIYRVTKVIGGRYREDFAGLQVASADPGAAAVGDPHAELILPVSYVFQNASFRLKGYSVMVGERPGLRAGGVWNQTCIFCHNTVPYFDDLWGALHGPGAPSYQGVVVDRVMPPSRRMSYEVTDARALIRAVQEEVVALGGVAASASPASSSSVPTESDDVRAALRLGMVAARAHFGPSHFIEIGIGCESCHGGSREHVEDPRRHP